MDGLSLLKPVQLGMVRCLPAQLVMRGLLPLLDTKEQANTQTPNQQGILDLGHLSKAHSGH